MQIGKMASRRGSDRRTGRTPQAAAGGRRGRGRQLRGVLRFRSVRRPRRDPVGRLFPPGNPTAALLSTFAIFAVAFFVRPLGVCSGVISETRSVASARAAVIILKGRGHGRDGPVAELCRDRRGRSYPGRGPEMRAGLLGRGRDHGREHSVAEYAPEGRRGFLTSFIQCATTAALLAGAAIAFLLTSIFRRTP